MAPRIHWLNTGFIVCPTSAAMYQSGVNPDVPGRQIKPYAWKKDIKLTNGNTVEGLLIPAPAWYIEGAGKKIIVDTGLPPKNELNELQERYSGTGSEHFLADEDLGVQLEKLGTSPSEIDIVILTHLHYDHIGMNEIFTNATFLVHPAEVAAALCPPVFSYCYPVECLGHLLNIRGQIQTVEGDYEVDPYVKMVYTGGHTEGHYVVMVKTAHGTACIAGDEVNHYKNLEYNWPRGDWFDLGKMLKGMQIIKSADIMLVGHDSLVPDLFPNFVIGEEPLSEKAKEYMYKLRTVGSFTLEGYKDEELQENAWISKYLL